MAEHAWSAGHQVDWNVVMLTNPHDLTTRIVQEAINIRTTDNTLNRESGALSVGIHQSGDLTDCICAATTIPSFHMSHSVSSCATYNATVTLFHLSCYDKMSVLIHFIG